MSKSKDEIYYQRNLIFILLAYVAEYYTLNMTAGWSVDKDEEEGWNTIVYIELEPLIRDSSQICFHMSPKCARIARQVLPEYKEEWDGEYFDTHEERIFHLIKRDPSIKHKRDNE